MTFVFSKRTRSGGSKAVAAPQNSRLSSITALESPYALDSRQASSRSAVNAVARRRVFFDGSFKGDYSLAIVNRYLARTLREFGLNLTLYCPELSWHTDKFIVSMPDIQELFVTSYPAADAFDIHLRNIWPPKADDMIGALNAYVCFAWEEADFPNNLVDHFNSHLDLIMVISNFVAESLCHSGVTIPIEVVGLGCDHISAFDDAAVAPLSVNDRKRFLHVSSCFPRKGADVLVRGFAEAFGRDDPVELVIKTFENPHNTIERSVAEVRAARPGVAPITVISSSLPNDQIAALYKTATALVAPSRGEGFGLPLAEAMVLGVPVITTNYSGQTDFCNPSTSWLVDFTLVPSEAHVTDQSRRSLWANPSLSSLIAQLHAVLEDKEEARQRAATGRIFLFRHFTWQKVAERTVLALALHSGTGELRKASQGERALTIDVVSTWHEVCGIAAYSSYLYSTPALGDKIKTVLAREIAGVAVNETAEPEGGPDVKRVWGYDFAGVQALATALGQGRSDILWFQHHPGFFSTADMEFLAPVIRSSPYAAKAMTMHNVQEIASSNMSWASSFDIIFVHTAEDAAALSAKGVQNPVVIPHGIVVPACRIEEAEPNESDNKPFTVATFGFLMPHKNIPSLVQAVARVQTIIPNTQLMLFTCERDEEASRLERARVEALIRFYDLQDMVCFHYNFMEEQKIMEGLRQADVIIFPYHDSTESASGAARVAIAADRPLVCSQSSVLRDLHPFSHVLRSVSVEDITEALIILGAHPTYRHVFDARRRRFACWFAFERLAPRYRMRLESLLPRLDRSAVG